MRFFANGRRLAATMTAAGLAITLTTGSSAAQENWAGKAEWDKIVAAAEKEGKLVVAGPSGKKWEGLLDTFSKDYPKIKIQVQSFAGRDFWPRAVKEREVGKYLWDIRVGGAETQVFKLMSEGGLAPVRDMMLRPDVKGEKNWYGGVDSMFLDDSKKFMPAFCAYKSPLAYYNQAVIPEGQISQFKEVLDPKWQGKIAMADPRGGSTIVSMGAIYKVLGPDFIKKLIVDQKPVITSNSRQLVSWFAQGQYPIALGMPNAELIRFEDSGVNLKMGELAGIDTWSAGVCGLQALEPRPNPNATIVFVNWILSEKVQKKIMAAVQLNSRRRGVPFGDPDRALDMEHLDQYMGTQTEEFAEAMASAKELIRSLIK